MIPMIVETDAISRLLNERNTALNQIEALVARIRELEGAIGLERIAAHKLKAENKHLRDGLSEALDWNWLDDDAPDDGHLRALLGGRK